MCFLNACVHIFIASDPFECWHGQFLEHLYGRFKLKRLWQNTPWMNTSVFNEERKIGVKAIFSRQTHRSGPFFFFQRHFNTPKIESNTNWIVSARKYIFPLFLIFTTVLVFSSFFFLLLLVRSFGRSCDGVCVVRHTYGVHIFLLLVSIVLGRLSATTTQCTRYTVLTSDVYM